MKMNKINNDLYYVGVNDHQIDLFEGQYYVPNGMAYNSYVIIDEKIAVIDTVDKNFTHKWLDNVGEVLGDKKPDYLVIQHMEPDHSANIPHFLKAYPDTIIVGNSKTFKMIEQFFSLNINNKIVVNNGDILSLGKHQLSFIFAPMVHWPEVMVTYDEYNKTLFSADGFGKFGALDIQEEWVDEARRYYIGIVGKYGVQVQNLLKKASTLDIKMICPLHGPILDENLAYYIGLYDIWSRYEVEADGIVVAYTSVYGNTKNAVMDLVEKLKNNGCSQVVVYDLARCDMAKVVADAFKYSKLVLATTTYNADIFPYMKEFINHLVERNFVNRTIGFIENGSWAPMAIKIMKQMFANSKNIKFTNNNVSILSSLNNTSKQQLDLLVEELCQDYKAINNSLANKNDLNTLSKIGYGLYVVTSNDGKKDNGLIVNTIMQITNTPNQIAVIINKDNYSHHVISNTKKMNVNFLTVDTPFKVIENFGFNSGRNVNKFNNYQYNRSDNGLIFLPKYCNSFISLQVEKYIDVNTHGMFICSITESRVINNVESMTYAYYQEFVKPKPEIEGKKGYICKVCGFVYEGEELPENYICPLCKHGVNDFEKIN